jgi:hypothetical protein
MSNREQRVEQPCVHLYLALARPSQGEKARCIRTVDKNIGDELAMLKARLGVLGGYWRIHRTVNARDVEKARRWLIKDLIDYPEHGAYVDSQWRTALLQPGCVYGDKRFMLDIDTQDEEEIGKMEACIKGEDIINVIKTPKGWHYITKPFDTRELCKLPNVTLIRDGYYFVCEVGEKKPNIDVSPDIVCLGGCL